MTAQSQPPALPAYRVKVSARAKYVRLKMTAAEGLVVVVPRGFDHRLLDGIVASRSRWIEKVSRRFAASPAMQHDDTLPDAIVLPALAEQWSVEYVATAASSVRASQPGPRQLRLSGRLDKAGCRQALRRWLLRHASKHLLPALDRTASELGLEYRRATVRGQRTRWGSCSSRATISLNFQLLFVTPAMLHYVLVHELCHTVHMNHSADFYRLLASYLPEHRLREAELKQAWRNMPGWLHGLQAG